MSFRLQGVSEFKRLLQQYQERVIRAVAAGVYTTGNLIMTDSKRRAPVDTGTLKGSGFVRLPTILPDRVELEVGYGGPAQAYAEIQHERTDFKHEHGEAKFLEKPMLDWEARYTQSVAEHAAAAFDTDGGANPDPSMPTTPWEGKT